MKIMHSIKAILPYAIAFLEGANAERVTGMPLDELAHQAGIQDAFAKPGLILGEIERHSKNRQQLAQLCRPVFASRLQLIAGLVQRITYRRGVATLLIPFGYCPVVMVLPLVFSYAGISLEKARAPHFSGGDFGRLRRSVGHLAGGKLFVASERSGAAEMTAGLFAATPIVKREGSVSVLFDGLCRLVFYMSAPAGGVGMMNPALTLN